MKRTVRTAWVLLIPMLLGAIGYLRASAQVAGFAELQSPQPGQLLDDLVPIVGTASHPELDSYLLEFAYDPNPMDSWFPLAGPVRNIVQDSRLAVWDTTPLTAGRYQLRLTVLTGQGQRLTAVVSGLILGAGGQATATAMAPASPTPVPSEAATQLPTGPAGPPLDESTIPASPQQTLTRVLAFGAGSAAALLLGFGTYVGLRPHVRGYVGLLRMRRIHRSRSGRDQDGE